MEEKLFHCPYQNENSYLLASFTRVSIGATTNLGKDRTIPPIILPNSSANIAGKDALGAGSKDNLERVTPASVGTRRRGFD